MGFMVVPNIFNIRGELQVPGLIITKFPIMSARHSAGFYMNGYIFMCNNAQRDYLRQNFYCEEKGFLKKLYTEGFLRYHGITLKSTTTPLLELSKGLSSGS